MKLIRPLDVILVALVGLSAMGAFFITERRAGSRADVYVNNKKVAHLDLSQAETKKEIPTPIGDVGVKYGQGAIQVTRSPCTHKLCIRQGAIRQASRQIVCLPAQLQIVIVDDAGSSSGDGLDAISY
jgi:hypothetical protein